MADDTSLSTASSWFLLLPDTDAAAEFAARARNWAAQEVKHASGRPWIVGRWAPETVTAAERGRTRVAVIGEHAVTPAEASHAAAATSLSGLDRCAATWPGSYHLLASLDGHVRAQGSVTGVRTLFHARAGTGPGAPHLAADRADVLAELIGAALDERRIAVQLLSPGTLHPLADQPVWRGMDHLPGDHHLVLDRDGRARIRRWWSLPDRDLPLAEGAARLREELLRAVEIRTTGRTLVTADLGGLDSTAVCSAAAQGGAKVVAYTAATHDLRGDDVDWARRTVQALGTVEHHIIPAARLPLTFDGVDALTDITDGPSLYAVDRNRRMSIVEQAAERGSTVHLSGFGGDELLGGASARVHDLARRHPRTAWRYARGFTAKYRWSRRRALRQLLDGRSYAHWLRQLAADLTKGPPPLEEPVFQWCAPPRMPPWATGDAVAAVRDLIREAAEVAQPLGDGHGEHRELATMRAVSRFARHINQMSQPLGIAFSAPYYDDRLIEAGLAVRPEERVTPWQYKPLIVQATRGVVPEVSRNRATKVNATQEEEMGLRRHRARLLALCEDSHLAHLGLVDPSALRAWCQRPLAAEREGALLHPTVGCEVWLRSRDTAPAPDPARR